MTFLWKKLRHATSCAWAMEDLDYKKLWLQAKNYISLQYDYSKLTLAEKLSILLSRTIITAVCILVGACILYQLSAALVVAISISTGNEIAAYLIVSVLLVVLLLIMFAFRTQLIINPVSRFITKLFYQNSEEEK